MQFVNTHWAQIVILASYNPIRLAAWNGLKRSRTEVEVYVSSATCREKFNLVFRNSERSEMDF